MRGEKRQGAPIRGSWLEAFRKSVRQVFKRKKRKKKGMKKKIK